MDVNQPEIQMPKPVMMSDIGGDPQPSQKPNETPPAQPTQDANPQPAPAAQKIVVGDKTFNSPEEAIAYANGLAMAQAAQPATAQAPAAPAPKVKLGQLLFENPDEAIEQLREGIKQEVRQEQSAVAENQKFWETFYTEHSDLVGSEFLVDAVLARGQQAGSFAGMTRAAAAPILAAMARKEVGKIRGLPTGGQALPSQPAVVAGASGASTPQPQPAAQPATNFVSELRQMRKRG